MQAWLLLALVPTAEPAVAQRPLHTYSIVARDPQTGQLGVAVQTHWFAVGNAVPWAESGVGAVATQSFTEISYGPLGLELMRAGRSAPQALAALLHVDEQRAVRQVAMVDAEGKVASHTGERCIEHAGHQQGDAYSVQANLMASAEVWPAMARAYETAEGPLAERMLLALEAAERAGGDIRGRQSAALLVVAAQPSGKPWQDRLVDLRVDDSPQPLVELRRLLERHRAYEHMDRGDAALAVDDLETALAEYAAAAALAPDEPELVYWQAVSLVSVGRLQEALPLFRQVFAAAPRWRELTPRLVAAGLLEAEQLEPIMAVGEPR